jgi:hypothetical protein
MKMHSLVAAGLVASLSAQTLVYDNGPWVTDASLGLSVLQTTAPFNFFVLGFNVNNAANVRQTEEFTVQTGLTVSEIEVFFYNTNATATSCTGVFLSLFDGNPATGTPNQLIPGAGAAVSLFPTPPAGFTSTNTFTGTYRVTSTTLTNTARQIQSVRVAIPTVTLTPGTYYLQWSFTGLTTPFFPPITTLNVFNTGNAQQYTAGAYATLVMTAAPAPGTPIPGATQGAPFRLYGTGGLPGAILPLGGGCSQGATFVAKGAPTIGGHLRADLSNSAQLALGAVILGFSNPAVPLGPCGCVLGASTDFIDPAGFIEVQIPAVAGLIGFTLFTQGAELDLAGIAGLPCNVGIGVALTDAFSFQLNIN